MVVITNSGTKNGKIRKTGNKKLPAVDFILPQEVFLLYFPQITLKALITHHQLRLKRLCNIKNFIRNRYKYRNQFPLIIQQLT